MSAPQYAKDQPEGFLNSIEKVVISGATGTVGSRIVNSLLKTGKHNVTALARKGSSAKFPEGVKAAPVDFDDEASLVAALKGQHFFIITVSPMAPRDTHSKLVQAAAKAGIPYVMPNGYGGDLRKTQLGIDTMLGPPQQAAREEIESLGMKWIAVCCGFWYDYSLSGGEMRFGFDLEQRKVTFYDDGTTKNSTSTVEFVGAAVAKLLSLKVLPEDAADESLTLSRWFNAGLYVQGMHVSQRDMLESVKRVTGTKDADWEVAHEPSKKRYEDGIAMFKTGDMRGFGKLLYARAFYAGDANEHPDKVENKLLGLPEQEDIDTATKTALAMAEGMSEQMKERLNN